MKKERAFHIASVDDYDDNDSEEPVETLVFPFLAYDPGLLDTAVILISTSRTQSIHVVQYRFIQSRLPLVHICSSFLSVTYGSNGSYLQIKS